MLEEINELTDYEVENHCLLNLEDELNEYFDEYEDNLLSTFLYLATRKAAILINEELSVEYYSKLIRKRLDDILDLMDEDDIQIELYEVIFNIETSFIYEIISSLIERNYTDILVNLIHWILQKLDDEVDCIDDFSEINSLIVNHLHIPLIFKIIINSEYWYLYKDDIIDLCGDDTYRQLVEDTQDENLLEIISH